MSGPPTTPRLDARWPDVLAPPRAALADALLAYTRPRRWFRGKARVIRDARVADVVALDEGRAALVILEIRYAQGDAERYLIPLAPVGADGAQATGHATPDALVARLATGALVDGLATGQLAPQLFAFMRDRGGAGGENGELRGEAFAGMGELGGGAPTLSARVSTAEQSNSSVVLGERALLKTYRRLVAGPNPECELGRLLGDHPRHPPTPRLLGSLVYRDGAGTSSVAVAHQFLISDGDGWAVTTAELRRFFARAVDGPHPFVPRAETLGRRTGEIHLALFDAAAAGATDPALLPEPLTDGDRAAAAAGVQAAWRAVARGLLERLPSLSGPVRADVQRLLDPESAGRRRLDAVLTDFCARSLPVVKTRIHGDLHLGQVLCRRDDFVIIDFEGEPARPLAERRAKASPLRDVVGMLRSFDYAPEAVLREPGAPTPPRPWIDGWKRSVEDGFLRGYRAAVGAAPFLPPEPAQQSLMLRFYALERVLYEIGYELDNRPDWVDIPLRGLCALADAPGEET